MWQVFSKYWWDEWIESVFWSGGLCSLWGTCPSWRIFTELASKMKCLNTGDKEQHALSLGRGRLGAGWSPECEYMRYLNLRYMISERQTKSRSLLQKEWFLWCNLSYFLLISEALFAEATLAVMRLVSAGFGCLEKSTNGTHFKFFINGSKHTS